MRISAACRVFIVGLAVLSLQACGAPMQDVVFVQQDKQTLSPLKVVRYETGVARITRTQTSPLVPALFGPFGLVALAASQRADGKKMVEQFALPDFGQVVMAKMMRRLPQEVPQWPTMVAEDKPVAADYTYSGPLLTFLSGLSFATYEGLNAATDVKLTDANGTVRWQTSVGYNSREFKRDREVEQFEADNGRLLKEEWEFAAETIATRLIRHLKAKHPRHSDSWNVEHTGGGYDGLRLRLSRSGVSPVLQEAADRFETLEREIIELRKKLDNQNQPRSS